jgi:anaerobic selenocysteine-containing dehydrogenase
VKLSRRRFLKRSAAVAAAAPVAALVPLTASAADVIPMVAANPVQGGITLPMSGFAKALYPGVKKWWDGSYTEKSADGSLPAGYVFVPDEDGA